MKKVITTLLFLFSLAFVGCANDPTYQSEYAPAQRNFLGIIKSQDQDYVPTTATTADLSTRELYSPTNFTGEKVTLLWGLITIKDY